MASQMRACIQALLSQLSGYQMSALNTAKYVRDSLESLEESIIADHAAPLSVQTAPLLRTLLLDTRTARSGSVSCAR